MIRIRHLKNDTGVGLIPLTTNHNYLLLKPSAGLFVHNFNVESDSSSLMAPIITHFGLDYDFGVCFHNNSLGHRATFNRKCVHVRR